MDCHPVRTAGIYEGEVVDARIADDWITGEPVGWRMARFYESGFSGEVRNFRGPPVVLRTDLTLSPLSVAVLGGATGASDGVYGTAAVCRQWQWLYSKFQEAGVVRFSL
jgi:hypothetical protein